MILTMSNREINFLKTISFQSVYYFLLLACEDLQILVDKILLYHEVVNDEILAA